MNFYINSISNVFFMGLVSMASMAFAISGQVKDVAGLGIPNAYLSLLNVGNSAYSDAIGNYSINESSSLQQTNFMGSLSALNLKMNYQGVFQTELIPGSNTLSAWNSQGQLLSQKTIQVEQAGIYPVEFLGLAMNQTIIFRKESQGFYKANPKLQASALVTSDTLFVGAVGYKSQKILISDMNQALDITLEVDNTIQRPAEWMFLSHDNEAPTDYDLLFPDGSTNTITINIASDNWSQMLNDMKFRYPGGSGYFAADPKQPALTAVDYSAESPENPIYRPVSVTFNGVTWNHVGMRFKGNASLQGSWAASPYKMPFKLDFDEYEDLLPAYDDQRFFGVKQIGFYNHHGDYSNLREKLTGELFRGVGVPVPHRDYFKIYIDYDGAGPNAPLYFGVYTGVEAPDGALMKHLFGNSGGNIYKPEAPQDQGNNERNPASLKTGGVLSQETFQKKNNKSLADWSDASALIAAINDATRTSNPSAWRAHLETKMNIYGFLKFLATNTLLNCTDSYGGAPHNYYLYQNIGGGGQFEWIAYDLNDCMRTTGGVLKFDKSDIVSADWPLIGNVMADAVYQDQYWKYLREVVDSDVWKTREAQIDALLAEIESDVLAEQPNYSTFWPDFTGASQSNPPTKLDFSTLYTDIADLKTFLASQDAAAKAALTAEGY